jgi:hypothetical protein
MNLIDTLFPTKILNGISHDSIDCIIFSAFSNEDCLHVSNKTKAIVAPRQ